MFTYLFWIYIYFKIAAMCVLKTVFFFNQASIWEWTSSWWQMCQGCVWGPLDCLWHHALHLSPSWFCKSIRVFFCEHWLWLIVTVITSNPDSTGVLFFIVLGIHIFWILHWSKLPVVTIKCFILFTGNIFNVSHAQRTWPYMDIVKWNETVQLLIIEYFAFQ